MRWDLIGSALTVLTWLLGPEMPEPLRAFLYAISAGMIAYGIAPVIFGRLKPKGRRMLPILAICGAMVGLVLAVYWFVTEKRPDNEYMFYRVDIQNPKDLTAQLPIWVSSKAPSPFENVVPWFAPWAPVINPYPADETNPYWSIGHQMKIVFPFVRGDAMYGRLIPAADYRVQIDTTYKGLSYHFEEHLDIREKNGSLVQTIEVWRSISGGPSVLVYSSAKDAD